MFPEDAFFNPEVLLRKAFQPHAVGAVQKRHGLPKETDWQWESLRAHIVEFSFA